MTDHPNLDNMCRNLDRLMTVEARLSETSRDTIAKLYDAAVAKQGGPLSLRAARLVLAHAKPGRVALIVTGAGGHDFMPNGETDGPLGAVVLARAIHEATGAVPILLTDHHSRDSLEKTALAAGLGIRALDVVSQVAFTTHVVTLPPGEVDAAAIFEQLDPTLICSVERLGPARDGIAYNATGNPAAAKRAKVESLFDLAAERGIATFGTGDNGNEIGFGLIHAAVVAHKTYGERLGEGGEKDVLLPANTSNWGAYAVVAAMAAVLRRPELVHDPETEARILAANVAAHSAEGSTGRHVYGVDGMPGDVSVSFVNLMRCIVTNGLKQYRRGF